MRLIGTGVAALASDLRGFMGMAHFIYQGVEPLAGFRGRHARRSGPIAVRECVLRLRSWCLRWRGVIAEPLASAVVVAAGQDHERGPIQPVDEAVLVIDAA